MFIETDLNDLGLEETNKSIDELTDALFKLREHRSALEEAKNERYKYINKFFIQNLYEEGIRYMYVLDCKISRGELCFLAYGAEWKHQDQALFFISPEYPTWFDDVKYGELEEVNEEDFRLGIVNCVRYAVNDLDFWRKADVGNN